MVKMVGKTHSWIEIDANIMRGNITKIRRTYENTHQKAGVVLKANAYGHGLLVAAEAVHDLVDAIYTTAPDDAISLKTYFNSVKKYNVRIVNVGIINTEQVKALIDNNIEFALVDKTFLSWDKSIFSSNLPARIHLFIDTGLGREGIRWDEIECVQKLSEYENCHIVGLMTHFSDAEHEGPPIYAQKQVERFYKSRQLLKALVNLNIDNIELHLSASVPSVLYPAACADITRLGIMLYGYWTSVESEFVSKRIYGNNHPEVLPVLTWKATSNIIKVIPKGDYIGYDCAHLCVKDTAVAVLGVGYFDGYPYLQNTNAWVLVDGVRCPIVGNVMMNSIVVDITSIYKDDLQSVEVILIGKSGNDCITADTISSWARTINYHVLTSLGAHLERKLVWSDN